jgi:putative ABC transport system permease protein
MIAALARLLYELIESLRIAWSQIRANKTRSTLTALGVIIGIVAVTLMGAAIIGISTGFENSLAMLGNDVFYVEKWPWFGAEDWWNYINRPNIRVADAEKLNRVIDDSSNSLLQVAVPRAGRGCSVKFEDGHIDGIFAIGTSAEYSQINSVDFVEGRLFNEVEANGGRAVCVLGFDVAEALFPKRSPLGATVVVGGHPCQVIGVFAKQGEFLGLFSFDNQVLMPINAFTKMFGARRGVELQVKVRDRNQMGNARDELVGAMRRVRGQVPGERDNFSINEQQAFKAQLDPVKNAIAFAGVFITGLSLFVGAIGIMNITFVSVKERTKEIGTRKAIGARRRTILLQFLIEAASISLIGGVIGIVLAYGLFAVVRLQMPNFPVEFSAWLVLLGLGISVIAGILSGFIPAWGASRLDPVVALRYE